jgi:hypothetical protein
MKHADRDPTGILEELDEKDVEMILYVACADFGRIAKGKPVEVQVYEAWSLVRHWTKVSDAPLKVQPLLRKLRKIFPGLTTMPNEQARAFGWSKLQKALRDPSLQMEVRREVTIINSTGSLGV